MSGDWRWLEELNVARVTDRAALDLYARGVISKDVLAHYLWIGGRT